jgi:hypothetical protein
MNQPPGDFIRVHEDRLLEFVTECFRRSGLDTDHAALIARLLVNNDLRGVRSHGFRSAAGCAGYSVQGYRGEAVPASPPVLAVSSGNPPFTHRRRCRRRLRQQPVHRGRLRGTGPPFPIPPLSERLDLAVPWDTMRSS